MKRILFIPPLVVVVLLLASVLLVAGTLDLLFNAVHLHVLSKHMTRPVLDQLTKLGEWGRRKVQETQETET